MINLDKDFDWMEHLHLSSPQEVPDVVPEPYI